MAQIQQQRVKHSALSHKRNRWTSILTWATFILAFASFSTIWYSIQGNANAAQAPADSSNSFNQNQNNQSTPYSFNSGSDPFAGSGGQVSPGRNSGGGFRSRAS